MTRTFRTIASACFLMAAPAAFAQTATPPATTDQPDTPAVQTPDDKNPKAPVPGKNSFTEDQAKERMTDAGFTDPKNLTLGEDGIWRAEAQQGGQSVKVMLDFQGNVTTE